MPTDQWPYGEFEEKAEKAGEHLAWPTQPPMFDEKWDKRFLKLAQEIGTWSKDPSTKVGAVIVDKDKRIISTGFNGFPKGVEDTPERLNMRDLKYKMIIHAERNALLFARQPVVGCALYTWPFQPCAPCAALIIQAGIFQVVSPLCPPEQATRWREEMEVATMMLYEAGVGLRILE